MINDDVVKCPLCRGFTRIDEPVLLTALNDPRIRGQIEKYIDELLKSPVDELSRVGAPQSGPADVAAQSEGINFEVSELQSRYQSGPGILACKL